MLKNILFLQALLAHLDDIENLLGKEWHRFKDQIRHLLTDLLDEKEQNKLAGRVNRVYRAFEGTSAEELVRILFQGASQQARESSLSFGFERKGVPVALKQDRGEFPFPETLVSAAKELFNEIESQRYTDLTIYEGYLYLGDDFVTAPRLPDEVPLAGGNPYTLEVAIRSTRTGIDSERESPRSVRNPREDKEMLTVYVVAESKWPGVEIEESLTKIAWPYDSDSESALFRLKVKPTDQGNTSQGFIEVRLYDRSLDLLDIVKVFLTVAADDTAGKGLPGPPARYLQWPENGPGVVRTDANAPQRLLSIHVSSMLDGYRFEFLFRRQNGEIVKIPMLRDIYSGDLENLLVKVRDFWTELVISNYAAQLSVTHTTFENYLNRLKDLGLEAWLMLFGARYPAGSSETLGELLATMQLAEGAHIQITYGSNHGDFIFPWSILYPPTEDSSTVYPLLFWGACYQIEQVTAGPKQDKLSEKPIRVLFALDRGFGNSTLQIELFNEYRASAGDKLVVTDPISDQHALFDELVRNPSAHLIYFYCHGFASNKTGNLRPDGIQLLKQRIKALAEDSPERQALETLINLTARMGDESWMFIGDSEIRESKLKLQKFFAKRRPIVFLNMCQSADLLPTMSRGLVRVFLDHNASAVIGTECLMTAIFAHAFSDAIFEGLFGGEDIGTALWNARRRFLGNDMRNPLGLAYTLYGRGTARLSDGPIVDAPEEIVNLAVTGGS